MLEYLYNRETSIKVLNEPKHPALLAYSRMMDRLYKMHNDGKLTYDAGGNWARFTYNKNGKQKSVQVNDIVTFPGEDIKYSVHISFYAFKRG